MVTNDPEVSEDQGSEAEDKIIWTIVTNLDCFVISTHDLKSALQEVSSSMSTSPVQFEGETLLSSEDPARMHLQKTRLLCVHSFCICVYHLDA